METKKQNDEPKRWFHEGWRSARIPAHSPSEARFWSVKSYGAPKDAEMRVVGQSRSAGKIYQFVWKES